MNEEKELFLPDTTVKLGTLRRVLNDIYGLDIIKLKMTDTRIASEIVNQLGGMGRLNMMTGAYNFGALPNGVTFRIKNQKANVIKITLTSMDLYNLEVGRLRGGKYTVVVEKLGLYNDMLKPAIEKATGMYLSMKHGGNTTEQTDIMHFEGLHLYETENGYGIDNRGLVYEYKPKDKASLQQATKHFERVKNLIMKSRYAKGSTIRASNSPVLEFVNFEDNWHINLLKLNPNRNQNGLLYKGGNKYAVIRSGNKDKQELFEFKTLEEAEDKFDKLVTESTTYSPIRNQGKIEGNYADGGGVGGTSDSSSTGEVLGGTYRSSESGEMIGGTMASSMYKNGGGVGAIIEVVGKGDRGAFRKREYEGMTEKEVSDWWESRGYKPSKNKSESKLKPYTFYINKYANGGGIEIDMFEIWENEKYGNNSPLSDKDRRLWLWGYDEAKKTNYDFYEWEEGVYGDKSPLSDDDRIIWNEGNLYSKKKYANGGGIGGTSDSAEMDAPTLGGTMSSSMFEGDTYSNRFENKLWNEIADGTPHSFKKGGSLFGRKDKKFLFVGEDGQVHGLNYRLVGITESGDKETISEHVTQAGAERKAKLWVKTASPKYKEWEINAFKFKDGGNCGCKEKYDEGGNAECGCWHYDIGGL